MTPLQLNENSFQDVIYSGYFGGALYLSLETLNKVSIRENKFVNIKPIANSNKKNIYMGGAIYITGLRSESVIINKNKFK